MAKLGSSKQKKFSCRIDFTFKVDSYMLLN